MREIPKLRRGLVGLVGVLALCAGALPGTAAFAGTQPGPLPHNPGGYVPGGGPVSAARQHVFRPRVLPTSVDLRSNMPAAGDQGQIGSCVAWTIAYGMMGYYARTTNGSGAPYAPLYLYMRVVAPGGAPNAGLYPGSALTEAQANGVDTQSDYFQGTTNWQTPPTAAEIANAANYKVTGWNTLWVGAQQGMSAQTSIQTALASGAPVGIAFPVFRDFMYMGSNVLYNTLTGTVLGYHMVAAVGYDAQGIWIRNSWGPWWGTHGDAHLSWAFVQANVQAAYTINGISTPANPVVTAPTVTGLSPRSGTAGASVTISGTGLSTATAVAFGGTSAAFTTATSATGVTSLVATAPAHATGPVTVTVTNPAGTSKPSTAGTFTYLPPPPAVSAVSPSSVVIYGGATVTVTGTGLTGASAVKVGSLAGTKIRVLSPTSLQFVAPALPAGSYDVTVRTGYGTSATSSADQITYVNPPAPVLAALSPTSALTYATTTVQLTGSYLTGATQVTAAGVPVRFTRVSDTSIRATLPPHDAGTVDIQVTTPGGTSPTGTTFTYLAPPAPSVRSISPSTGFANVSRTVTITGSNLTAATMVTVDGVPVRFRQLSASAIQVTLPAHAPGAVNIQVTTRGGTSSPAAGTRFTYSKVR